MTAAAALHLRRVRFKDGRTLEVLRPMAEAEDRSMRQQLADGVQTKMRQGKLLLAGYGLVVWFTDGSCSCDYRTNGQIPSPLIPDLVRGKLLAELAVDYAVDTIVAT